MSARYLGSLIMEKASKQDWLIVRKVVKMSRYTRQNWGQIPPGELFINGVCDPIGMYILSTSKKGHGICIIGSGKNYPQNLLASIF